MIKFFQSIISTKNTQAFDLVVLVIAGQSNSRGNTLGDDPSSQYLGLANGGQIYNYVTNQFENIDFNNNGSVDGLNFGIDISFAHTVNKDYLIGKRASGGTDLETQWQPNTSLNNDLQENINNLKQRVIDDGYNNPYWVFYWNQGEADAINARTSAQYESDWSTFFNDLETNKSFNQIFITKLNQNGTYTSISNINEIRNAVDNISSLDNRFTVIDMNDYTIGSDGVHYQGVVQEQLGVRVFNELNI